MKLSAQGNLMRKSKSDNNVEVSTPGGSQTYDVLVVGSGIAGTAATMAAAETNPEARIAIASVAPLFSGSSFAPTTWLLGLISPGKNQAEQEDLARRIIEVGGGSADEALVKEFVSGIEDAVRRAQSWGVEFLEPSAEAKQEKEYIACFDDTLRKWRGLVRASWRATLGPLLEERGIDVLEGYELLDLGISNTNKSEATFFSHGENQGSSSTAKFFTSEATFFCHGANAFFKTRQKAIVLASGGSASLWPKSIGGHDAQATAHAIAMNLGAKCTNMASTQFMPTITSPVDNVVFNEKAFRFMGFPETAICDAERELEEMQAKELTKCQTFSDALEARSGYGPYSERLSSKVIDHTIYRTGADGLELTPQIGPDAPELIRRYLEWLSSEYGVAADAPLRVALRAQASNGGIAITADGGTGIPSIYAAGECTGGMHGKDRIGGLSSANALTFGIRAGEAAARYSADVNPLVCSADTISAHGTYTARHENMQENPNQSVPTSSIDPAWLGVASADWNEIENKLKETMQASFGPIRDEARMAAGCQKLERLAEELASTAQASSNPRDIALTRRTALRIETAQEIAKAARQGR